LWGDNSDGQCGFKTTTEDKSVNKPTLVKGLENFKVKQIACGASHTLILADENDGYTAVFATGKSTTAWMNHGIL
jgi:alpha-tubulin suppressor-like RCC1 family protein